MQIIVIGDPTTCLAFSLGGITTRAVKGREMILEALKCAVDNQMIGLVLITEKNAALVRSEVDTIIYTMHRPLIVEIPDTTGSSPERPSAGELILSLMGTIKR
jgi:V/A-type H+-transporting ATPase subunit F